MKNLLFVLMAMLLGTGIVFSQGTWTILNTSNSNIPSDRIVSLGMTDADIVYIGTPGGLVSPSHVYEYDGTDWVEIEWIDSFNDMKSSPAGHLVIATGSGVYHYDGINYIVFNKDNSNLTATYSTCVDVAPDETEYAGLTASGLLADGCLGIYDGTGWMAFNASNSPMPVDNVLSVLKSYTGALWIGTNAGGLVKKVGDVWEIFNMDNSDIPGNTPTCLAETADGPLWIAFANGSIATFDGTVWNIVREPIGKDFPNAKVIDMLYDADYNIWLAFENAGLGSFDGNDWVFYTSLNSGLPNDNVTGLELDSQGNIWISTDGDGVAILDPEPSSTDEFFLADKNIIIYPNPVTSVLNIEYKEITGTASLYVYDLTGQLVIYREMNESVHDLDCSGLSPGLYTLNIKNQEENLSVSKAFVKR